MVYCTLAACCWGPKKGTSNSFRDLKLSVPALNRPFLCAPADATYTASRRNTWHTVLSCPWKVHKRLSPTRTPAVKLRSERGSSLRR